MSHRTDELDDEPYDSPDDYGDDVVDRAEERHEEVLAAIEEKGGSGTGGFGCGCLVGIALTLFVIYMGWFTPWHR